jgi:hypothetical protein
MSALDWKSVLELGRHETKSELDDDDQIETVMEYLMEKAPKSCYNGSKKASTSANASPVLPIIPLGIQSPSGLFGSFGLTKKRNKCY